MRSPFCKKLRIYAHASSYVQQYSYIAIGYHFCFDDSFAWINYSKPIAIVSSTGASSIDASYNINNRSILTYCRVVSNSSYMKTREVLDSRV